MACTLAACALEKARLKAEWACEDEVTEDDDLDDRPRRARPASPAGARTWSATRPSSTPCSPSPSASPGGTGSRSRSCACRLDRLGAIRDLLGPDIADRLVQDLARTVASLVRASDIVARLDDDRIVALLVRSRGEDAMRVARTIGRTVAESGLGAPRLPGASVSIGVAEFPAIARDASSLIEAADEAMARRGPGGAVRPSWPGRDRPPATLRSTTTPLTLTRSPAMSACVV